MVATLYETTIRVEQDGGQLWIMAGGAKKRLVTFPGTVRNPQGEATARRWFLRQIPKPEAIIFID